MTDNYTNDFLIIYEINSKLLFIFISSDILFVIKIRGVTYNNYERC